MSIANACDLLRSQLDLAAPVIEQNEIVAGSVHFCESQHLLRLTYSAPKSNVTGCLPGIYHYWSSVLKLGIFICAAILQSAAAARPGIGWAILGPFLFAVLLFTTGLLSGPLTPIFQMIRQSLLQAY
jgi:hypothetical protein